jgi:hypothetical protein
MITTELSTLVTIGPVYIYVSHGSTSLAFEVKREGDWRSRFIFYDELTSKERDIIKRCIIEQGGSLTEGGWYFADNDVKAIARQERIQQYLKEEVAHHER